MLHPKENNVLYCVQDVVFVFAKLQDGALRSGFSCNFAAIHLLGHDIEALRQVCYNNSV